MSKKQVAGKPNPPKRPMSAYFLFLNDIRPELKKEQPNASVSEVSKLAGERWSHVDAKTKQKYEAQQEEAKKAYIKVKAEYEAKHGPIKKERKKKVDKDEKKGKKASKK